MKESYYICQNCGRLSTLSEQLEVCDNGGMPYCYCKFMPERIFVMYKKINKKLWKELKELKTNKLRLRRHIQHKANRGRQGKNE